MAVEVNGGSWWWLGKVNELAHELGEKVVEVGRSMHELAEDDPRRVVHSFKVGLALTLVSFFYCYQPLFGNFGVTAMWVVVTVVVVFEFHVGATLGKSINRGIATLLGGALGVGAHQLRSLRGSIAEPILLGLFVFVTASTLTFVRFFPKVKARYDYGVMIFILTLCLVYISGFGQDNRTLIELTQKRISTIVIGGATCVIVSTLVCPVWAGLDLHRLVSLNLDNLGNFLQGFGENYFGTTKDSEAKDGKSLILQSYKSVLNSKATEESLANLARWEPGHGGFKFRHPWERYLKLGALTRQCAYKIEALNSYLNTQVQTLLQVPSKIEETCTEMSMESGKALKELSSAMTNMTQPDSSARLHVSNAKHIAENLKSILKSCSRDDSDLSAMIATATMASLLVDVVECVDDIADSVYELASLAGFKIISSEKLQHEQEAKQNIEDDIDMSHDHVEVTIIDPVRVCDENEYCTELRS